jgi:hypothetical protein
MRVLSGRASFGARSVPRAAFIGAAAILGLFGCGNNTFTYGTSVITFSATPGPFSSYLVEVDQILLTRTDNTPAYPLLQPEVVDFAKLNDTPEVFGAPAILEGTYTSATITLNYAASIYQNAALLYLNVNGQSVNATPIDPTVTTATALGQVAYTVKFDPAHPLVITRGKSVPLEFNFDLSAASVVNETVTPPQVAVRPFISASTQPNYTKPLRTRGVYVTTDTANNNNFTMNARAFFDTQTSPVGAVEVQTDDNTAYNVNGVIYKGAAGLAAMSKLQINTVVEAFGTFGDLDNIKPNFVATQVYAGVSVENLLTDRITGTVSSRVGNTLSIHGAEIETRCFSIPTGVQLSFANDYPVTVGDATLVSVDGHPELGNVPVSQVSVGQQVDIEAIATTVNCGALQTTADATGGLVRLTSTPGWATLNSAAAGGVAANLLTLGGFQPEALTFTGTGSAATGADANPTAYAVDTTGIDTSAVVANSLFRFDGEVTPFGAAPPDFTAATVTPGAATDQILTVEWSGSGTVTPFVSKDSTGLIVDIAGGGLGATHLVQTGPLYLLGPETTIDLTNPMVNPRIVADPTLTAQFTIGNPSSATGLALFNDYASFLTQLNAVVTGANTFQKLVAVGRYDQTNNVFTANRIDMVQLP